MMYDSGGHVAGNSNHSLLHRETAGALTVIPSADG